MFKRIFRSRTVLGSLGGLLWAYMVVLARTLRWRVEGEEYARELWLGSSPFIVAGWHSRILLMPWIQLVMGRKLPRRSFPLTLMVSASKDGDISDRMARLMGLNVIRASAAKKDSTKDKRGVQGAREAIEAMRKGGGIVMTVDGPRGPAETVVMGAVKLAQQTASPILIFGVSASARRLNTWDRLLLPLPFARGAVVFDRPMETSRDMDSEALRQEVERRLKLATERADRLAGLTTGATSIPVEADIASLGTGAGSRPQ
jgi:lysophospholipid acyltransferase (LPLAT)-like uncharacterized protein